VTDGEANVGGKPEDIAAWIKTEAAQAEVVVIGIGVGYACTDSLMQHQYGQSYFRIKSFSELGQQLQSIMLEVADA